MKQFAVSIVIPSFSEGNRLVSALTALQACRTLGCEIIVVEAEAQANTVIEMSPLTDHYIVSPKPGRAFQMNLGASVSRGEYLLFLHADTRLPDDMARIVSQWIRYRPAWGFFSIRLNHKAFWAQCISRFIGWRSRLTSIATGDQVQFVRRDIWTSIGGFPSLSLMEDVALSKRLRQRWDPWVESAAVTTSARRWQQQGVIRTVLLMWWLRWCFWLGKNPDTLAISYGYRVATPHPLESNDLSSAAEGRHTVVAQLTKSPQLGLVKTRLQPVYSQQQSLDIHRLLTWHSLETLLCWQQWSYQLWVAGDFQETSLQALQVKSGCPLLMQPQGDLGARMLAISQALLENHARVILVGSDCPYLTRESIKQIIDALKGGEDAVLIPAVDGGYVALGLSRTHTELFCGVDWGSAGVLQQTEAKLASLGWRYCLLSPLADIDRPEDVLALCDVALGEDAELQDKVNLVPLITAVRDCCAESIPPSVPAVGVTSDVECRE